MGSRPPNRYCPNAFAISRKEAHIAERNEPEKQGEKESICMNGTARMDREQKLLKDHPVFLPGVGHKRLDSTELLYIEEVHRRAETVTPLLKDILEFRPPPHRN